MTPLAEAAPDSSVVWKTGSFTELVGLAPQITAEQDGETIATASFPTVFRITRSAKASTQPAQATWPEQNWPSSG
ncbi:MAG: hypothetical protein OEQ29_15110 [Alphaproteobacteria bacterium]|nr:hypothetical protein [Alphaproteobacteria bacterium]